MTDQQAGHGLVVRDLYNLAETTVATPTAPRIFFIGLLHVALVCQLGVDAS